MFILFWRDGDEELGNFSNLNQLQLYYVAKCNGADCLFYNIYFFF